MPPSTDHCHAKPAVVSAVEGSVAEPVKVTGAPVKAGDGLAVILVIVGGTLLTTAGRSRWTQRHRCP